MKIPPILLERDDAPLPEPPAKIERFALAPAAVQPVAPTRAPSNLKLDDEHSLPSSAPGSTPNATLSQGRKGTLPPSYGTSRLLLTARDTHWLYAHWDLTAEQMAHYNKESANGHLGLRVHKNVLESAPAQHIDLYPDSNHWFVPVDQAGTRYIGEIGYDGGDGNWHRIAVSDATLTPPEAMSDDTSAKFAVIPLDVPLQQLLALVKTAAREQPPLALALGELKEDGYPSLPASLVVASAIEWTPVQERALARVISLDPSRRVWMGSLEITEVIRRQLAEEISSGVLAARPAPGVPGAKVSSLESSLPSSPAGGGTIPRARGFWFNINAELVIYGATEPDAQVDIGGRKVKLRPDGTFSFRFILPDGQYELPVAATSADGVETRRARLRFERATEYKGRVEAHPQGARLKKPQPESVA